MSPEELKNRRTAIPGIELIISDCKCKTIGITLCKEDFMTKFCSKICFACFLIWETWETQIIFNYIILLIGSPKGDLKFGRSELFFN